MSGSPRGRRAKGVGTVMEQGRRHLGGAQQKTGMIDVQLKLSERPFPGSPLETFSKT